MYELKIEESFAAAHRLRGYQGQCEDLHGHNWKVEVVVQTAHLNEIGLAIDFHELKSVAKDILKGLDHTFLNDLPTFAQINPSSENIARYIFDQVAEKIEREGLRVHRVTAWESERACASYLRD